MNKRRRDKLSASADALRTIQDAVQNITFEEQDSLDGIPENLRSSERYSQMEAAVEYLTEAGDDIAEAIEKIAMAID